jgi:hypothetical protein
MNKSRCPFARPPPGNPAKDRRGNRQTREKTPRKPERPPLPYSLLESLPFQAILSTNKSRRPFAARQSRESAAKTSPPATLSPDLSKILFQVILSISALAVRLRASAGRTKSDREGMQDCVNCHFAADFL